MGDLRLSSNLSLLFGYRYLDVDWSKGSGSSRTEYDIYVHGPIVGLRIAF